MNGLAKHWSLKRQQRDLTHVLRRPIEVAGNNGLSQFSSRCCAKYAVLALPSELYLRSLAVFFVCELIVQLPTNKF
jgi:hypothetical protein